MQDPDTATPWAEELRAADESAVLLDSPHSGSRYPEDFRHACPRALLRETEDMFVDRLYAFAPSLGATLVRAHFPRSYLDANRSTDDLDPLLLGGEAPEAASDKSRRGMGLCWRLVEGPADVAAAVAVAVPAAASRLAH